MHRLPSLWLYELLVDIFFIRLSWRPQEPWDLWRSPFLRGQSSILEDCTYICHGHATSLWRSISLQAGRTPNPGSILLPTLDLKDTSDVLYIKCMGNHKSEEISTWWEYGKNVQSTLGVQHNKKYHRKVLLSSFHLNGHTLGFDPQTQKLEPPCTA